MNKYCLLLFCSFFALNGLAQIKLSGLVKDAQTGEVLIGATIVESNTNNGVASNTNGYFSILSKHGNLQVSYIGYKTYKNVFEHDQFLTILLEPGQELDEVTVKGPAFSQFNVTSLDTRHLETIPAMGAKPDVMKTLQLMPGIQSQSEGTSLINVRGGNPGENLYMIDQVPLIYVNHLGGFTSVFNPDMINAIEVYKGGFPPQYGGKLSSVMNITQREGNNKTWKGNLGLGLTDASFSVEGPLVKDKVSMLITGRKTMIDALMALGTGILPSDFMVFYGFHDLNAKLSYRPDEKNSFHLNVYQGDDYISYSSKRDESDKEKARTANTWGNWMVSGRWSRVIGSRLFVNNIVSTTNYRLKVKSFFSTIDQDDHYEYQSTYLSKVGNVSFRSDWQFKLAMNYDLEFGAKLSSHHHIPNKITNNEITSEYETARSFENAVYLNNKIVFLNFLDADIGARLVAYRNGLFSDYNIEPRLSVNGKLGNEQLLNFTFQRVKQYGHLLFTSGAIMNNEIWVPADQRLAPSESMQYAFGWKGAFMKGLLDAEVSYYYKSLSNLTTYKEGYSNLLGDGGWRSKIEDKGRGESSGVEILLRKNTGAWTGFMAYTYSTSTRQFDGINKGEVYVYDFDRPHSFSVSIQRKLSANWDAGLTWVYQSGLPYTPVVGRQYLPNEEGQLEEAFIYGERNSRRMSVYHRLDLGLRKETRTKKGRRAQWNFSVYNAYNRKNPSAVYYSTDPNDIKVNKPGEAYEALQLYQLSFFPLIPTASYKVFFD